MPTSRAAFARKPRDEWVAELAPADTCVGPVYSVPELVADAHVVERGLIGEATRDPGDGSTATFPQLGTLLAGTDTSRREFRARDQATTDTDELLAGAGLSPAEITALHERGIVA